MASRSRSHRVSGGSGRVAKNALLEAKHPHDIPIADDVAASAPIAFGDLIDDADAIDRSRIIAKSGHDLVLHAAGDPGAPLIVHRADGNGDPGQEPSLPVSG